MSESRDSDATSARNSCRGPYADAIEELVFDFDLGEPLDFINDVSLWKAKAVQLRTYYITKDEKMYDILDGIRGGVAQCMQPGNERFDWLPIHRSGITKAVLAVALDEPLYTAESRRLQVRADSLLVLQIFMHCYY